MSKLTRKKFKITDMHCVSCAMNIDFDLEDVTGIKSAKTNFAKAECIVEYDEENVTVENIIERIKETGYTSESIEASIADN